MSGAPPSLEVAGHRATVTLRRPDVANRLSIDDLGTLGALIARVDAMPAVRVLVLAAEGRHFCAGFDLGALDGGAGAGGERFEAVAAALAGARPVTVAAIQGGVYGGAADLALACDFRLGTPAAELRVPAVRIGLLYHRGGLERFVRRLGLQAARRILLAAQALDSAELHRIGFLDRVHAPAETFGAASDTFADELAAMAPLALHATKRHLAAIADGALDPAALAADVAATHASADLREGVAALRERRAPHFTGR